MARSRSTSKTTRSSKAKSTKKSESEKIEDAEVVEEIQPEAEVATESDDAEKTSDASDDTKKTDAGVDDPSDASESDEAPAESSEASVVEADATDGDADEPSKEAEQEPAVEQEVAEAAEGDVLGPVEDADDGSDTAGAQPLPVSPAPPPRRDASSTIIPLLIGGAAAALIGFLVARYAGDLAGPRPGEMTPEEIAAALATKDDEISDLRAQIEAMAAADPLAGIDDRLAPIEGGVSQAAEGVDALSARLTELSDRVETIAMRPAAVGVDPGEFDAELQAFREELASAIGNAQAEIAEARKEAERISEEAFRAEQSAAAQAAWAAIQGAIDGGGEYSAALTELQNLTQADVPMAVADNAADGVPTLAELQRSFAPAAREAVKASIRSDIEGSTMDRLTAFLRVQTGARSLEPREGDDPDAILSRAEAALQDGDLETVLTLVGELPEPGQAAMADWVARAESRLATLSGAAELGNRLNLN